MTSYVFAFVYVCSLVVRLGIREVKCNRLNKWQKQKIAYIIVVACVCVCVLQHKRMNVTNMWRFFEHLRYAPG